MSEQAPPAEPAEPAAPAATPDEGQEPDTGSDLAAEVEKWKTHARKHEERAKANSDAAKELAELKKQSMSEQEKAVDQAKAEARAAALAEFGGKVAAAEVRAAAAGRLSTDQINALLENLNVARFLDDSGEVDRSKVDAFIDGIAPKSENGRVPNLGQGVRQPSASAPDLNSLIHAAVRGR